MASPQDIGNNQLQLELSRHRVDRVEAWSATLKSFFAGAATVLSVWMIMSGLQSIIDNGMDEGRMNAFARIVEAFKLGTVAGYGGWMVMVPLWLRERIGKKRAIREKARLQRELEKHDPNRTSSNLTVFGETPK